MSANFPTLEELETKSIDEIRSLYPYDSEDEKLMQSVLDKKRVDIPIVDLIDRKDVPDIRTPEEEAKWQKIVDERQAKIDKQFKGEAYLEKKVEKLEEEKKKLEEPEKGTKIYCAECGSKSPVFHKKGCSKIVSKKITE